MRLIPAPACAAGESEFEHGSFATLLTPQQWSAIELMGRPAAFPRGSVLMFEHDPSDRVMVLLDGRVKVTHAGTDGQELLVSIRGPGEIVGELPRRDPPAELGSVTALEPLQALVIDARQFHHYVARTPGVALVLLEVLSQRLREAVVKRAELTSLDTIGRLAASLVELAERYGTISERGIVIGLPLSQEELGAWVGACHAGLANALHVLRELGWIETQRRRIIVRDLDALRSRSA
jgi:CRP-like cAMP-binding protein